jgi:hypothetical protein
VASGKRCNWKTCCGQARASRSWRASGERADYQYEEQTLAPWLSRTMARLHPAETKPAQVRIVIIAIRRCGSLSAGMPRRRACIWARFARVARACEYPDWSVLPWSVVKQHPGASRPAALIRRLPQCWRGGSVGQTASAIRSCAIALQFHIAFAICKG